MQKVARIMRQYGGLVVFDCAAWASHLPIDMNPEDSGGREVQEDLEGAPDAVVLSPHKLPGGPGQVFLLFLFRIPQLDSALLIGVTYAVFVALMHCIRSCPGVLLAKKRIFKNAIPSCIGGGVVEHVSRDGAVWVEVSSVSTCTIGGRY
jgi:selenocysteine lyase/cysteine desulfurase